MEYAHPFNRIIKDEIHLYNDKKSIFIGGINAKNKVMDSPIGIPPEEESSARLFTAGLFEMIMMSDEELNENCGNLDHSHYRARLIKILHDLWD